MDTHPLIPHYFTRAGTVITPRVAGDDIVTSGTVQGDVLVADSSIQDGMYTLTTGGAVPWVLDNHLQAVAFRSDTYFDTTATTGLDTSADPWSLNVSLTVIGTMAASTFTDGTTTITGGNYTGVGNITGTDVDISAGTGNYTSTGTVQAEHLYSTDDLTVDGLYNMAVTTSTEGQIIQDSVRLLHTYVPSDQAPTFRNVFLGYGAGNVDGSMDNTAQPYHGTGNVGIGDGALDALTTGYYNFAMGVNALGALTSGNSNIGVGHLAGAGITNGTFNTFFGREAGRFVSTGDQNTAIGRKALYGSGSGDLDRCIAIGFQAGLDEDTDDRLIIDNRDRTSAALTRQQAILYGVMAAAPANQRLGINALLVLKKASGYGIKVDTTTPTFGWRDLLGDVSIKTAGANDPDYSDYASTGIYRYLFKNTTMTQIFNDFHIPHDYVAGTEVHVHIHWSQTTIDTGGAASAPGNAKWYFDANYSRGHDQAAFPASVVTVSAVQTASGTIRQQMIAEVQLSTSGQIGGQDLEPDGIATVRTHRDASDAADTLDQRPWVHHIDLHYQSTNIATKDKAPDFYA